MLHFILGHLFFSVVIWTPLSSDQRQFWYEASVYLPPTNDGTKVNIEFKASKLHEASAIVDLDDIVVVDNCGMYYL